MSPAPKKPVGSDLAEALAEVRHHHDDVLCRTHGATQAAKARQDSINRALANGASLRSIAALLDVSPETVRKMAEVPSAWQRHLDRLEKEPEYRAGYEHRLAAGAATDNPRGMSHPDGIAWADGWRNGAFG